MRSFPLFLRTDNRRVVIVGGGEQAAQKARLITRTTAEIDLMAPELEDELAALVTAGRARHRDAVLDPKVFQGALFAMIGTGCAGADAAAAAVARAMGVLVNVVDRPELCDVTTPALVDRDPLVVAIGTEGAAPVLARQVKSQLEAVLEPRLGAFTALAGALRARVAQEVPRPARRAFWAWAFRVPRRLFTSGRESEAETALEAALADRGSPGDAAAARISLLHPGSGAPDLVTLRAVQRLQEADLVLYTPAAEPLLELARRDAEREPLDSAAAAGAVARAARHALEDAASVVVLTDQARAVADLLGAEAELLPAVAQP